MEVCGADTPTGPCALPAHRRGWHDSNPPVIRVPQDDAGRPQVSITQLRRYGAVDLATGGEDVAEAVRGCPRAYALTYGNGPVIELPSRPAELGKVLHRALAYMEDNTCGPEEALGEVWPPTLGALDFADVRRILDSYISRGGAMVTYAALGAELDLVTELYVDSVHGSVQFRGIVDWLGVDPRDSGVLHVVDWKSAARPIARDSLRGDVQLMGYVWLVIEWWKQQHGRAPDRVVAHFDALRYSDVDIEYTRHELDLWHEWACAMVRTILRDDNPQPIPNDGCGRCPVRHGCPAWQSLPERGESMLVRLMGADPSKLGDRYLQGAQVLRSLEKLVGEQKAALDAEAHARGSLVVGDEEWRVASGTKTVANVIDLTYLLLPDYPSAFETAVTATRASVERAAAGLEPSLGSQVVNCVQSIESGQRISRKKRKKK